MAFYARLKSGISEAPRYGVFIYPGDKYRAIDDRYFAIACQDERLELMTSEEMKEVVQNNNQLVNDTVTGHWRRAEKTIAETSDLEFLNKVYEGAKSAGKDKIAELAKDRIDELTPSK